MCSVNPRVDFAFKKLFGSEENKDILIDFINSIVSEKDRVTEIELKNPYNLQNYKLNKLSVVDIKAKDQAGRWYNIEMQVTDQEFFDKRSLYYWSKVYSDQIGVGSAFSKLCKTIAINVLNFNCLPGKEYHNVFHITNERTNELFSDMFEMHFIELPKYDEIIATVMDRWVKFLKNADVYTSKTLPSELNDYPIIKKAFKALETMYFDEDEKELYEAGLKWLMDIEGALATAENRGIRKGKEEGIKEGIKEGLRETAINLKNLGADIHLIIQATGLTKEEIEKL